MISYSFALKSKNITIYEKFNLKKDRDLMYLFRSEVVSPLHPNKCADIIADSIMAAGLAKKAIVQISYAIGVAKPTSVAVDTCGTCIEGLNDDLLSSFVHDNFALTPNWITPAKRRFFMPMSPAADK